MTAVEDLKTVCITKMDNYVKIHLDRKCLESWVRGKLIKGGAVELMKETAISTRVKQVWALLEVELKFSQLFNTAFP